MRNGRGFFLPCLSQPVRSVRYRTATHVIKSTQAQHTRVAQLVSLEITDSTYEDKLYLIDRFAGAFRHNAQKNWAALSCRPLRRVTNMCSSNLSVNCEYFTKFTLWVTRLPFPYFAAVTCRQSAPDSPRERGDSQEGGNRRCLPSCAPARRQRRLSTLLYARAASAHSPPRGAANPR